MFLFVDMYVEKLMRIVAKSPNEGPFHDGIYDASSFLCNLRLKTLIKNICELTVMKYDILRSFCGVHIHTIQWHV